MFIVVSDLPNDVTEQELRDLLDQGEIVGTIEITRGQDPDRTLAIVMLELDRNAAYALASALHLRVTVRSRVIKASVPLHP